MKYIRPCNALAIMALVALSSNLLSTQALPLKHNEVQINNPAKRADPLPLPTQSKSPAPKPSATDDPKPTETHRPDPPTSKPPPQTSASRPPPAQSPQPKPSNPNPPSPRPTTHSDKPSNSHSGATTTVESSSGSVTTAPSSTGTPMAGDEVPTKVSTKVLIGIGTVCGLLIFILSGMAFCRHQRKKKLATALLEQTAQFNHNNPYAKLSEPMVAAKESLPMTPTKPIGTFGAISTYTPALADEIEICVGESVTILQEYDDGWCLAINNSRNGIKGVVPRHCLEGYNDAQYDDELGYYPPNTGFKAMANKRISSIPAGGWNNGPGDYHGGGYDDYPPNPIPQYNNQGYYNGNGGGHY
ncbi:hypothetical protein BGZ76_001583 [Entomortierella beljakovae]|nr:hypothetical protein BGZ76_001583 [Entomortierella beljakovae]